jgi:hypothetical protein
MLSNSRHVCVPPHPQLIEHFPSHRRWRTVEWISMALELDAALLTHLIGLSCHLYLVLPLSGTILNNVEDDSSLVRKKINLSFVRK